MFYRLWFLLCLCVTSLLSQSIKTFYATLEIKEPILLELISSPAFQRLKGIHQYGVTYYSNACEEKYTRYDHSLGVFAILRLKNCCLKEQIAGLLHDVSHTAFSHVGDWVFHKEHQEKDYQTSIHEKFLKQSGIELILSKYGYSAKDFLPTEKKFPALEQSLPNLSADRIDYNIQGAFYQGFITKQQALQLLKDLHFKNRRWVATNKSLIAKLVCFSLFMSQNCWGSAQNHIASRCLADALIKAMQSGLVTKRQFHFGTDMFIWNKLISCEDLFIQKRIQALFKVKSLYQKLQDKDKADLVIYPKFRGIDPWMDVNGKIVRFTSLDPILAKKYEEHKKELAKGFFVKKLPNCP